MNIKEIYKLGIPLTLASSLILGLIVNYPSHTQGAQNIDPEPFIDKTENPIRLARIIKRSCTGYYQVESSSLTAQNGVIVGRFHARRGCGHNVPNRCRRKARDAAHNCMEDHWNYKKVMPQLCQSEGVQNYNIRDLSQELTRTVCSYTSDPYFRANIYRVTKGNKGCGPNNEKQKKTLLKTRYVFRCGS
ncbi:MAG: hypothetical protein F6K18_13685 [Okeania sp. SIO2C2]|uniref:hypothetical protein n=1 Tax=Okeania sp. SIO2C2 TaxID=2607787 RepID=UPI0013B61832|nr:hypothetical protein [Okeania sp. SIO2C2]NEP87783.1 hypothetical protein [Okeania sp. SIO2C2]